MSLITISSAAVLASCAPVDVLNGLTPDETFSVRTDIAYGNLPSQKLDVYKPATPKADAPTVLFIYGGGWNSGHKDMYKFMGEAFAAQGYTTIIPTYRVYPDVIYPEFVSDSAKAAAWGRAEFDKPMVVVGHSAGAHIASLMALRPDYLQAENLTRCETFVGWVGLAGPYDFEVLDPPYLSIFPEEVRESDMLPLTYASQSVIPAMVATGTDDETVNPAQSERMATALQAAGTLVTSKTYTDIDHKDVMLRLSKVLRKDGIIHKDVMDFIAGLPSAPSCSQ